MIVNVLHREIRRVALPARQVALSAAMIAAFVTSAGNCIAPIDGSDPMTDDAKRARIDAMYEEYSEDFPDVGDITPDELAALRKKEDVVVIDVRTPEERAVSIIPGAVSQKEFEANLDQFRKEPIVTYCTIGYRSGKYSAELAKEGIASKNLRGSILAWVHAGLPVVDSEGRETRRVHVYGAEWDLLPHGYESVW